MSAISNEDRLICHLEIDEILSPKAARAHWVAHQRFTTNPDLHVWTKLVLNPGPVSRVYRGQCDDASMVPLEKYPSFGRVRNSDHAHVYEGLSGRVIVVPQREEGRLFEIQMWQGHKQIAVGELSFAVLDVVLAAWVRHRDGNDWQQAREFLCERLDAALKIASSVNTKTWNRA